MANPEPCPAQGAASVQQDPGPALPHGAGQRIVHTGSCRSPQQGVVC